MQPPTSTPLELPTPSNGCTQPYARASLCLSASTPESAATPPPKPPGPPHTAQEGHPPSPCGQETAVAFGAFVGMSDKPQCLHKQAEQDWYTLRVKSTPLSHTHAMGMRMHTPTRPLRHPMTQGRSALTALYPPPHTQRVARPRHLERNVQRT